VTRVTGDWLTAPGAQAVLKMLEDGGHRAYAVGGCVRNALLGEPVADVDISTDARPERVIELAKAAGLRAVPTGIDHGTVTLESDDGRGLCSVGIYEGGASNMAPAAEPYMQALGLEPVVQSIEGQSTTDMAVWRRGTTQMVISSSPQFSPGSEMVLSFELP